MTMKFHNLYIKRDIKFKSDVIMSCKIYVNDVVYAVIVLEIVGCTSNNRDPSLLLLYIMLKFVFSLILKQSNFLIYMYIYVL